MICKRHTYRQIVTYYLLLVKTNDGQSKLSFIELIVSSLISWINFEIQFCGGIQFCFRLNYILRMIKVQTQMINFELTNWSDNV